MPNYEVGDTVEVLNADGKVTDVGVVTKIKDYSAYAPSINEVWVAWEKEQRVLPFYSDNNSFRNKVNRKVEPEITQKIVYKVLLKYSKYDNQRGRFTSPQLMLVAEEIFQSLQAEQQELQRQNDPEYQKYLELKKKFETT